MNCHANLSLSLEAFRLRFGIIFLYHTCLIWVVPHDEYFTVIGVLGTGLSDCRGSGHG